MDSKMENPFACASCKKSFSQPKALHNHVEFYHRSKPLPVTEVSKNMEGMNQSENENCNIVKSPSVRPSHDASRFNPSFQDLPQNNLKNTGKDLVQLLLECLIYERCSGYFTNHYTESCNIPEILDQSDVKFSFSEKATKMRAIVLMVLKFT